MTCEACKDIEERTDVPHVIRPCPSCGRHLHIVEHGKHGIGLKINAGDQVRIPEGWLTMSLDPTKSRGQFTPHGLDWFSKLLFMEQFPRQKDNIVDALDELEKRSDQKLRESPLLNDWDIENPDHADQITAKLQEDQSSVEWWAMISGMFAKWSKDAIASDDTLEAVWAAVGAERARAMTVFKEALQPVVWMGHSAKRIIDVLAIWDQNKSNSDEGFWQQTFKESPYVLSQLFASPMVFVQDNASIAGQNIDRTGSKFVDYLYAMESSREGIAIEIKSPTTPLLGRRKYRGVYPPSRELGGAVVQVLDYRRELIRKIGVITEGTDFDIESFDPKCALIIGNGDTQLTDAVRRRSFELFQASQKDVEIVTYDNLFRKIEVLASLFNLVRQDPEQMI